MKKLIIGLTLLASMSSFGSTENNRERILEVLNTNYSSIRHKADPAGVGEKVQKAHVITDNQADAIIHVLLNTKPSRDLSTKSISNLILMKTTLTESQVTILKTIVDVAKAGNDFNENIVAAGVLFLDDVDPSLLPRLMRIANNAKYSNGIDDTSLFMQVLLDDRNL